jgi:cytochrome c556
MSVAFKPALALAAFIAVGAVAGGVLAQEMDDGDYIRARIGHYREIGTSFKAISDEIKSGKMRQPVIQQAAREINAQAKNQYGWFRAGSGKDSEEKTKAKDEIWSKPKDFRAAQDRFLAESGNFLKISAGTDPAATIAGFKALGQSCANCHTNFRDE